MRIVMLVEENRINVEGFSHQVDLSEMYEADIHALHWFGAVGEIEYFNGPTRRGEIRDNERITDLAPYQKFIDAWEVAARAS